MSKVLQFDPHQIQRRYYTPSEFAKLRGISLSQVYAKMSAREIPFVDDMGPKRIPRSWADPYLERIDREAIEETAIDDSIDESQLQRRRRVER